MPVKSLWTSLLLACSLVACVSFSPRPVYQKANGSSNGWEVRLQSRQLQTGATAPLDYEVTYRYRSFLNGPGGGTTRDIIEIYAYYRCAELAIELGKPYFILKSVPNGILDPEKEFEPEKIDYGPGYFTELIVHHSMAAFKSQDEAAASLSRYSYRVVHDARKIVERYRSWIKAD